jgi:hypothetical protein
LVEVTELTMEREQFLETNSPFVVLNFHKGKQKEMAQRTNVMRGPGESGYGKVFIGSIF